MENTNNCSCEIKNNKKIPSCKVCSSFNEYSFIKKKFLKNIKKKSDNERIPVNSMVYGLFI